MRTILRDEIKSILARKGLQYTDFAREIKVQPQSLSRKLKDEVFSYQDLAALAKLTDSSLCLVDKETKEVIAVLNK